VREIGYSQARAGLADIYDNAIQHLPTRITRRRAEPAVLVSLEDVRRLLDRFEFAPEVLLEESAVSIWLPELAVWGRGATYADARTDLVDEITQLLAVVDADARFRAATNVVSRLPWIYRLMLAESDGQREAMLFAAPAGADLPS
jgi:PHD/YefM family antitoxin component YafN of YafNO toxin-antitoxin module